MIRMLATAVLLALAWYAALNVAASMLAWIAARAILPTRNADRPATLLAIRMLPSALSIFFVVALFVPAHWRFEPRDARDPIGLLLKLMAALGAALLLRCVMRAVAVSKAEWRLHAWFTAAGQKRGPSVRVVEGLPGLTLAGLVRPLILVGSAARRQLTPAELDVALAHERAHKRAFDNIKRVLMFSAPDVFGLTRAGRQIEARWRESAELVADARAVHGDRARAVHLASALVKVARLEPAASHPRVGSPVWSTLHEGALLELRVRRLLEGAPVEPREGRWSPAVAAAIALGGAAICGPIGAYGVHQATELLVRFLP
ncbi:MAG: hypothetical protein A3H96_09685 [Acidobacteria bacterium RIFCSPLOWO2_02_FULL_67_36]|nr:MAG: hypothetical protein A3H96_09685 [Acidobacteria bacterium RIFCSPLOWO2_02_FULL_67_36]OFW24958.1 MAG: hypothetical protein A3G21_16055 [Acidobacteria bacterium RIFCSPLOWO2_12_FULL_66_21]